MGQLTLREQEYTRGRMMEVAMIMKKVDLHLAKEQLASLGRIMSSYLAGVELHDVDDKALFFLLYKVYEDKIRKKMLTLKPTIKLSFDMPQAWALAVMFREVNLDNCPYEYQLAQSIVSEIDHQTA
jgi:hypothetical protein